MNASLDPSLLNTQLKSAPPDSITIALWSLRKKLISADRLPVLDHLKKLGVRKIEVAGFCNETPSAFARTLKNRDLQVTSIHGPSVRTESQAEKLTEWACKYCEAFDTQHICVSTLPEDFEHITEAQRQSDQFNRFIDIIERAAETLCAHGLNISYHPYAHDFSHQHASPLVTQLAKRAASSGLFKIQFDTYWAWAANFSLHNHPEVADAISSVHVTPPIKDLFTILSNPEFAASPVCISALVALRYLAQRSKYKVQWILENDMPSENKTVMQTIEDSLDLWPSFKRLLLHE